MYNRVMNIDNPNDRVAATLSRDALEECLTPETETILRLAHSQGLLYGLLKRVGWRGSRCSCGCEEARFAGHQCPR